MLSLPGAQSREEQIGKHSLYAIALEDWLKNFLSLWLGETANTSDRARELFC